MLVIIVLLLFGGLFGQSSEAEDDSSWLEHFFFKSRWTRATTFRPCVVTEPPQNGNYTLFSPACQGTPTEGAGCWVPPGQTIPHLQILSFTCTAGYQLRGHSSDTVVSLCNDGTWSQQFPECQKMCAPLASPSVEVKCVLDGTDVACNKYMRPNTKATAKCREHFKQTHAVSYSSIQCLPNGEWDHSLIKCAPNDCGVPVPVQGTTDDVPSYNRFPWTAVLYQLKDGLWSQVCLGNLISPHLVVTGARCLVSPNGNLQPKEIRVGLGKLDREYSKYENHSVIVNTSELIVPPYYTGAGSFDVGDVGLVELAERVDLTGHIMPVCMDGLPLPSLSSGNIGYVSGWNESQGESILSGEMNFVDHENCKRSRRVPLLLLTYDKFCAEGASGISVVGKGDRGGGLTIVKNGKHFVVGVLSSKISAYQNTDGISLFTDIASQRVKKWLDENKARYESKHHDEECKSNPEACNRLQPTTSTTTLAPQTSTTTSQKGPVCKVPNPSHHRLFNLKTCPDPSVGCSLNPGDSVANTELVIIACSPGFSLVQGLDTTTFSALTSCSSGKWEPPIPQCYKLCQPLVSLTVDFQCWYGPDQVSCNKPMLPRTIVKFSCKEYHIANLQNQADGMKCDNNGEWTGPMPYCSPKCGLSNLNSFQIQSAILGSNFSNPGNFPWHAGIYHKQNDSWEAVCGGTLVTTRWILTAAHCVTVKCTTCKPPVMQTQEVMVSLGKNKRSWNAEEESGVKRRVEIIWVHDNYVGSALNYANDIAMLKMVSDIQVNSFVMPACVDYRLEHLQQLKEDHRLTGYVAGWGNTEECSRGQVCNTPSETLKYALTTVINFTECFKATQSIKTFSITRLTTDKYCAGNGSESVVQQGDSGGGLTFVFGGLHYIYGVVSVKLRLELEGKTHYTFGAFTSVTDHLDLLKSQLY